MARKLPKKIITKDNLKNTISRRGLDEVIIRMVPRLPPRKIVLRNSLTELTYKIRSGDNFYKLAHKFYGNKNLWYIIAWYNFMPADSFLEVGKTILIPQPVQIVLNYIENGER